MIDRSLSRKVFRVCNTLFFLLYAILCLLPMISVLSVSISASSAVAAGKVLILPVEMTSKSYEYILGRAQFWQAMWVSFIRVALGTGVNMLVTVLAAYPLSKSQQEFRLRTGFAWFFAFTTLFGGGMIPTYMVVRATGILDSIWSLVLPGAVPVFNVLLLLNYFRSIPRELEESAFIDGAGHFTILLRIYLPVSLPTLATLVVFAVVGHWNSWFDGLIYMQDARNYPLQTYLQSILVNTNSKLITKAQAELLRKVSDRTLKSAQIFIAAIPVLMIYPFLQRYFISGIMLGSVKE